MLQHIIPSSFIHFPNRHLLLFERKSFGATILMKGAKRQRPSVSRFSGQKKGAEYNLPPRV